MCARTVPGRFFIVALSVPDGYGRIAAVPRCNGKAENDLASGRHQQVGQADAECVEQRPLRRGDDRAADKNHHK